MKVICKQNCPPLVKGEEYEFDEGAYFYEHLHYVYKPWPQWSKMLLLSKEGFEECFGELKNIVVDPEIYL